MNSAEMNGEISVVMATFNGERYVKEQLDSILKQTLQPKEIVIVDDCSTDNTWAILQDYALKHPHVKVFRNDTNMGAHQNFRKAFSLSSCPLIAPSDQDDLWREDKLEVLNDLLTQREVDLVYSQEKILWENGDSEMDIHDMPLMKDFIWGNCLKGHTFLFKRTMLEVYDIVKRLSFDYALAIKAGITGSYASTNEILSIWRRHSGVMTTAKSDDSELIISDVPRQEKIWYAVCHLKKERSMPIEVSFHDRSLLFSLVPEHKHLSRICKNIAKQTWWSMLKASLLNVLVQSYEKGIRNKMAHAMWAMRQPWIYWYDMHLLKSLE